MAYARQLYGRDDLAGGSFDTQFTFAQTLTETAKSRSRALVVISIPASARDTDGNDTISEEEVARTAAKRCAACRTSDGLPTSGRPPIPEESFGSSAAAVHRADGGGSGTDQRHRQCRSEVLPPASPEFPSEVTENALHRPHPRHLPDSPELFDRLYQEWSTLERFQRTRGVLRLMNTIVGSLWRSNDTAPLIMPGSVPLGTRTMTEISQYLGDQWKVIIDTDVDGTNAAPTQVDWDNPDLLGKRFVTQRLARTVFVGATPL